MLYLETTGLQEKQVWEDFNFQHERREKIKMARKWKYSRRLVDGVRRKIKYHRKADGGYLVRRVGVRNSHD